MLPVLVLVVVVVEVAPVVDPTVAAPLVFPAVVDAPPAPVAVTADEPPAFVPDAPLPLEQADTAPAKTTQPTRARVDDVRFSMGGPFVANLAAVVHRTRANQFPTVPYQMFC